MKNTLTIEEKLAGWKNNALPYVIVNYEKFKKSGVDIFTVSRLTEKKLISYYNIPENKAYIVHEKEKSQVAENVGGQFQRYWAEVLIELYPNMKFRRGTDKESDIVCETNPELNHELKSSISDNVYSNGWIRPTYYSPKFSNHMANKNASTKPIEECHCIYVKYQVPEVIEDSIKMTFVSYLYVKPENIKEGETKNRNAYIKADTVNKIVYMIWEDTSRIKSILEKEKEKKKPYIRNTKVYSTSNIQSIQNSQIPAFFSSKQIEEIGMYWLLSQGINATFNTTTHKLTINSNNSKEGHYEKVFNALKKDLLEKCNIKTSFTSTDRLRSCTLVNTLPKPNKK